MTESEFLKLLNEAVLFERQCSYDYLLQNPEVAASRLNEIGLACERLRVLRKELGDRSYLYNRVLRQKELLLKIRDGTTEAEKTLRKIELERSMANTMPQMLKILRDAGTAPEKLRQFERERKPFLHLLENPEFRQAADKVCKNRDPRPIDLIDDESLEDLFDEWDGQGRGFDIFVDAFYSHYLSPLDYLSEFDALVRELNPEVIRGRRSALGPLILSQKVPDSVLTNLERARHYYAYGMPEATVVFAVAMLEAGLKDYYERAFRPKEVYMLRPLLREIARIDPRLKSAADAADESIEKRNLIVHSSDSAMMEEAQECLKASYNLVEKLFG